MDRLSLTPRTAAILAITAAVAGFGAGSGTYALLADTESGTVSIVAASSFDSTPPGAMAWDDVDGDRVWDAGEPTYPESTLYDFSNASVDLIVPADVGPVDNETVSITANSIETRVPVEGTGGDVTLEATGGDVNATDQRVNASSSGDVRIVATGTAIVNRSTILAPGTVNVTAGAVEADGATVESQVFGFVTVAATAEGGGPLSADGATMTAEFGNVELRSIGDVVIDSADVEANGLSTPWFSIFGEAMADLGDSSATLHVAGAQIADLDDTLVYDPDGIAIDGTPASGTVSAS